MARNTLVVCDDELQVIGNTLVSSSHEDDAAEVSQTTDELITSGEGHVARLLTNQSLRNKHMDAEASHVAGSSTCSPLIERHASHSVSLSHLNPSVATPTSDSNSLLMKLKRLFPARILKMRKNSSPVTTSKKVWRTKEVNMAQEALQLASRAQTSTARDEYKTSNLVLASRERGCTPDEIVTSTADVVAPVDGSVRVQSEFTPRRPDSLLLTV